MNILWIYKINVVVIFFFPFLWEFGFIKRAKRYCNGINAKLPFLFFFFVLLFIPSFIWFVTGVGFLFLWEKKTRAHFDSALSFLLIILFSVLLFDIIYNFVCFYNIFHLNIMQKYKKNYACFNLQNKQTILW